MSILVRADDQDVKLDMTTDFITVIDKDDCVLDRLTSITYKYIRECCGRCVYGYEGATQIHSMLSDITQKKGMPEDINLLSELSKVMLNQTLCDIGASMARLVLSALEQFRPEIEFHITKRACLAGVCRKLVTFHILPERCIGCGDCMEVCEDDAIEGKKKYIHIIDQGECIQCGECMEACPHNAIVTAGTIKPKCPKKPIPYEG